MVNLSILSIWNALSYGGERFNTLKGVKVQSSEDILWSDDYSVLFIVDISGEQRNLKVFYNEKGDRAQKIISTFERAKRLNYPFVSGGEYYPNELVVFTTDGASNVDTSVILFDMPLPDIFTNISQQLAGVDCALKGYVTTVSDILRYGLLFDLLFATDFRIDSECTVSLSPSSNYIFSNTPMGDNLHTKAFINFIIGVTLRIAIDSFVADSGEGDISYPNLGDRFDSRVVERYINADYIVKLGAMMDIAESECERNCEELRRVISSTDINNVIDALHHFCDSRIEYVEPRLPKCYEIIGCHSENRISVRDKRSGLFGYVDFKMKKVIECLYSDVTDFVEEVAVCAKGDMYGAINREGEEILPFEYESCQWDVSEARFICVKEGKEIFINRY